MLTCGFFLFDEDCRPHARRRGYFGWAVFHLYCHLAAAGVFVHPYGAQPVFPSSLDRQHLYLCHARGTPLLLQLLFIYFGLPVIPVVGQYLRFGRFMAACIGFTLNYAAYFAEIFRGGLLSIDKGQVRGQPGFGAYPFANHLAHYSAPDGPRGAALFGKRSLTLVKDTSLLYAVSVPEILHYAQTAVKPRFEHPALCGGRGHLFDLKRHFNPGV